MADDLERPTSSQPGQRTDTDFQETFHEGHQNEAASLDSKYKAIWDAEMGTAKRKPFSYRKVAVLLLAWHPDVDDLHTKEEIDRVQNLFNDVFHFDIVRETLTHDDRPAQAQVNFILAQFVLQHGDPHALLIVYYAGHGRPGESSGDLRLPGRQDLVPKDSADVHEVIWNSAEHNIRGTQCDVLVIFDCCHAGELEKSVRGKLVPRAFEYLAATSANSTTRKPGKASFTTALIWAFKELVKNNNSFTTQDLVAKVLKAPDFPPDQSPRLSERGPSCTRKIVLAPLKKEIDFQEPESDENEEESFSTTTDLSLRFVFKEKPTEGVVKELAFGLRQFISDHEYLQASTILWEGLDTIVGHKHREAMSHFWAHKWMKIHQRKKSEGTSIFSPTALSTLLGPAVAERTAKQRTSLSVIPVPRLSSADFESDYMQDQGPSGSDTGVDTPLSAVSGIDNAGLRRSARGSYKRRRDHSSS